MQEKIGAFAQELAVLALLFVLGTGSAFEHSPDRSPVA